MSIRRGEVPFVANRVGRSQDPREVLGLARELRIERATALGYVTLWEEFILEVGDALTGRVKGYSADHIAEKLGWRKPPPRLIDALKRAGVLATHKGTFVHPTWAETITGQYAIKKARDRETWRLEKEAQRNAARASHLAGGGAQLEEGGGPDVRVVSTRTGAGRPAGLHPENGQKERKESAGHLPPAPPQGGGELASQRWEWLEKHHNAPMNPRGCAPYLAALTPGEWAIVQWVTEGAKGGGPISSSRKKRAMGWDTYKFLSTGAHTLFLPEWRRKLQQDQRPQNGHAKPAAEPAAPIAAQQDRAGGIAFLLAQVHDESLDAAKRQKARARLRELYPDAPLPEEPPAAPAPLQ